MENGYIENQGSLDTTTEFKTNSIKFWTLIVCLVISCLFIAIANSDILPGAIIISLIIAAPSFSKLFFHSMTIRDRDIEYKVGWLKIRRIQIPFDSISAVDTEISLFGRIFGYGTVTIMPNNSKIAVRFNTIKRPEEIKRLIDAGIARMENVNIINQPSPQSSVADEILKLQQLKDSGAITAEELEIEKNKLLNN